MADKPVTREEKYLAYLTGDYTGEIPKPITRKEKYLYELCLKGIGGEISPEEIEAAVNEYLEKNPVKPGATTEQAQQIEQNKTNIGSLKEDFTNNKTFKLITSSDIVKQTKSYVSKNGELVEVPFTKDLGNFINGNIEYSTDFSIIKLNLSAVRANRKEYDLLPFDNTRKIIDFGEIVPGFKPAKKLI